MARADPLVLSSTRFIEHATPPGHPEQPARGEVMAAVAARWAEGGGRVRHPLPATDEMLGRVHDPGYIAALVSTAGRRVQLDPDTYAAPTSEAVARLAAGAAVAAVDHTLAETTPGVALVRPPGHHAEQARAMGFCLYNNVAVAAAHARASGIDRVAVVDYDVHHGNGTQWTFYDDPAVLYVSTHQYPFYPGTGAAGDVGRGAAAGATVNVPLAAGAGDADLDLVLREIVLPVLEAFAPGLVVVSAGFDAHAADPLGGFRMSTGGFRTVTRRIRRWADAAGGGRLAIVTEGGYDLTALEACLAATLEVAAEDAPGGDPEPALDGTTDVAEAVLGTVRRALAPYWSLTARL